MFDMNKIEEQRLLTYFLFICFNYTNEKDRYFVYQKRLLWQGFASQAKFRCYIQHI